MKKEFGVVGSWESSRVESVQELGPGRVRSRAEASRASRVESSRVVKLWKLWSLDSLQSLEGYG